VCQYIISWSAFSIGAPPFNVETSMLKNNYKYKSLASLAL